MADEVPDVGEVVEDNLNKMENAIALCLLIAFILLLIAGVIAMITYANR